MWFKNLQIYRLPKNWSMDAAQLEPLLESQKYKAAASNELESIGWCPVRENGGLVHTVNKQMLISLHTEKKLLPGSVITYFAKVKAKEIEEQQGFAPGKKAMKEIKERVADELLPRAFPHHSNTMAWIDPVNGWLVIDSASAGKADEVIKRLLKAIDKFPVESLRVAQSPVNCMTRWLEADEAPHGFTVDQDTELRATGESKAAVRYVRHTLDVDDIGRHIAAGKQCTRLAMTWNDKISFILAENLTIKKITPLDVIKENATAASDQAERFDNDFAMMTGELNQLMSDIVESLGGVHEQQ